MIVLVGDEIQCRMIKSTRGYDIVEQLQWRPTLRNFTLVQASMQ
jgi:hypothetical protein